MALFTTLAIIAILLALIAIGISSIFGTIGMVLVGDIIVCVYLIVVLIKYLAKKKKK